MAEKNISLFLIHVNKLYRHIHRKEKEAGFALNEKRFGFRFLTIFNTSSAFKLG